jgi:hypothetical protein
VIADVDVELDLGALADRGHHWSFLRARRRRAARAWRHCLAP